MTKKDKSLSTSLWFGVIGGFIGGYIEAQKQVGPMSFGEIVLTAFAWFFLVTVVVGFAIELSQMREK